MSSADHDGTSAASNRDAALERAWREASTERPPSHLDAALVAAARKSVATRDAQSQAGRVRSRPAPWLTRWQPLLAAAGVAGLALVLVPMLPREHEPAPATQRQPSSAAPTVESSPRSSSTADDVAVVQPVPPPPPPADAMAERRERVVPAPRPPEPARPPAGPAPTRAAPPASAEAYTRAPDSAGDAAAASAQAGGVRRDAAAWAATIEALHGAGEFEAAASELRAFRAVEPDADAYLAEPLREWARTVEPFPPGRPRE